MIVPPDVDLVTATDEQLVEAYVAMGFTQEDAQATVNVLRHPVAGFEVL